MHLLVASEYYRAHLQVSFGSSSLRSAAKAPKADTLLRLADQIEQG